MVKTLGLHYKHGVGIIVDAAHVMGVLAIILSRTMMQKCQQLYDLVGAKI